eukprot:COSAG05_NODE_28_length_29121_cov_56.951933_14_plen_198_part_00
MICHSINWYRHLHPLLQRVRSCASKSQCEDLAAAAAAVAQRVSGLLKQRDHPRCKHMRLARPCTPKHLTNTAMVKLRGAAVVRRTRSSDHRCCSTATEADDSLLLHTQLSEALGGPCVHRRHRRVPPAVLGADQSNCRPPSRGGHRTGQPGQPQQPQPQAARRGAGTAQPGSETPVFLLVLSSDQKPSEPAALDLVN